MTSLEPPANSTVVLLVDDHAFVATVMRSLLASERDVAFHHCDRARDAVARATELAPDVIFQDLVMPEMDGLSLVQAYRCHAPTSRTPVVVLSGNDDEETRAQAMAAGAHDYLVKLPAKDALIACIRRYRRHEGDGDPEMDRFIAEAEARVASLRDAAERHDTLALGMMARSLKGSSLNMGANRLAALCIQVERDAKTPARAKALIPAVDEEFARLRSGFRTVQP